MEPNNRIKEALAIAIVRQKRMLHREMSELRVRAQHLEDQLAQQKSNNVQLQQWTNSILQKASAVSIHQLESPGTQQHTSETLFLPPLALNANFDPTCARSAHQDAYECLQQQLLVAAEVSSRTHDTAAAEVLNGKSAALSDMLLTNIQMLKRLQGLVPAPDSQQPADTLKQCAPSAYNSLQGDSSADIIAAISTFIQSTLLQVPGSSLRTAYMQQCAAMVAALLVRDPRSTSEGQQQQQQLTRHGAAAAEFQLQMLSSGGAAVHPGAVALQALKLMQQLLQCRLCKGAALADEDAKQQQQQSPAVKAGATVMLQHLSSFPATALLIALAVAQQLQGHVQHLQQANAAMASVQLGSLDGPTLQLGTTALAVAASEFEVSHDLLEELVSTYAISRVLGVLLTAVLLSLECFTCASSTGACSLQQGSRIAVSDMIAQVKANHACLWCCCASQDEAIVQLPTWAVALAECSWTTRAVEDLASVLADMYSSCQELQQYQPLLVTAICQLAASLATRLQQLATNTEAPGMRAGSGAALRSVCGAWCLKLRDMFMPE